MEDNDVAWTLDLIKKLQYWEIGDYSRLEAIKNAIENGRKVYESDKQYLKQKNDELLALEAGKPARDSDIQEEKNVESRQNETQTKHDVDTPFTSISYCPKCGYKIQDVTNFCPKCGVQINPQDYSKPSGTPRSSSSRLYPNSQIPFKRKSEKTTLLLAIALGLIGFCGIGHIYLGKTIRGIGFLILGIVVLFSGSVFFTFMSLSNVIGIILLPPIVILSTLDARNIYKKHNMHFEKANTNSFSDGRMSGVASNSEGVKTIRKKSQVKKIIVIAIIGILIISSAYIWQVQISPEIDRVNKINQKIEEQNQQEIRDRGVGDYDCYYDEVQKVNNCIRK